MTDYSLQSRKVIKGSSTLINRIYLGSNLIYGSSAAPSAPTYTYLQYAESSGASVITDFYPDDTTVVQAYANYIHQGGDVFIGNTQTPTTETDAFRIFKYENRTYLDYGSGQGYNRVDTNNGIPASTWCNIEFGNRYIIVNQIKTSRNSVSFSQKNYPIKIFSSTDYGQVRHVKIYTGAKNTIGTLARDYRAVIRDTDNKVGMLDELTGTFIEPTGGSWTAGPVLTT